MALKTKVKVGKITSLSDARYCSGMGVDFLGFPVRSDTLAIDLKSYQEITGWISGPAFGMEWTGEEVSHDFLEQIREHNADYIEVSADLLEKIPAIKCQLMVTLEIENWNSLGDVLRKHKKRVNYLSLATRKNGAIDSGVIREIASEFSVLLNVGVSQKNMDMILSLPIAGIALEGTQEDKPGFKEYLTLSEMLENLEVPES
jgi:phosphoribosylanthranilate isomerase